jgi:bifunctional non-homologous end joining protein LigD
VDRDPLSVLSGDERAQLRRAAAPSTSSAMRAVLTKDVVSGADWLFERKLDGIRCVAIRSGDQVRLLSRNDLSMNDRYPEIAEALARQAGSRFAVDGEVVAFDGAQTSFSKLSQRGRAPIPVFFYIFDIVWIDGQDTRRLPLRARKRVLRAALRFDDPLRLTAHRNANGEALFAEACRKGWEGLIAKRVDSVYSDARSRDWLKLKCSKGQELVIGGFTAPKGSRTDFGAVLVGYYDGNDLRYAGKVGTGFDQATLGELGRRLRELERPEAPFVDAAAVKDRSARWVNPSLVAQIDFTEWTSYGRLRHPRFLGLRDDKAARSVVREG